MPETLSLCAVRAGAGRFGVEPLEIREVLGGVRAQPVPLAPLFVAGIVPYRGEILTVLSLRALLGLEAGAESGGVLVFADEQRDELYGVEVDVVEGVTAVEGESWQANPATLDARLASLFRGSYRDGQGLIVRLEASELAPARLTGRCSAERTAAVDGAEAECTR